MSSQTRRKQMRGRRPDVGTVTRCRVYIDLLTEARTITSSHHLWRELCWRRAASCASLICCLKMLLIGLCCRMNKLYSCCFWIKTLWVADLPQCPLAQKSGGGCGCGAILMHSSVTCTDPQQCCDNYVVLSTSASHFQPSHSPALHSTLFCY